MARDLRDPQKLGEFLQKVSATTDDTLSQIYDYQIGKDLRHHIPDYPQDESMATVTAREYREELRVAASEGDKYAESMLLGLQPDG